MQTVSINPPSFVLDDKALSCFSSWKEVSPEECEIFVHQIKLLGSYAWKYFPETSSRFLFGWIWEESERLDIPGFKILYGYYEALRPWLKSLVFNGLLWKDHIRSGKFYRPTKKIFYKGSKIEGLDLTMGLSPEEKNLHRERVGACFAEGFHYRENLATCFSILLENVVCFIPISEEATHKIALWKPKEKIWIVSKSWGWLKKYLFLVGKFHFGHLREEISKSLQTCTDPAEIKWMEKEIDSITHLLLQLHDSGFQEDLVKKITPYMEDENFCKKLLIGYPYGLPLKEGYLLELTTGAVRERVPFDHFCFELKHRWNSDISSSEAQVYFEMLLGQDIPYVRFMQKFLGYCLSSDVSEKMVAVWYGNKHNGKTMLWKIIQKILGQKLFLRLRDCAVTKYRSSTDLKPGLNRLGKGARVAVVDEIGKNAEWDTNVIKSLGSGCDSFVIRGLHKEEEEINITSKLIICTNDLPTMECFDDCKDRLWIFPFLVTFFEAGDPHYEPNNKFHQWKDPNFKTNYLKNRCFLLSVLKWLQEGFQHWWKDKWEGKTLLSNVPEAIRKATREYAEDLDSVSKFIQDKCQLEGQTRYHKTQMYHDYKIYCEMSNILPLSFKTFFQNIKNFLLETYPNKDIEVKIHGKRCFAGIGPLQETDVYSVLVGPSI